ncbi:hypothetical protein MMC19_005413 [Ptychographa xylographoides]|nr:hypothetical protein [Ptychographa xylographoides]
MLIRLLALISFVHSFVAADVKFIAPAGGAKVTAGAAIQIKLGESGTSTPITDLAGYTIYLMVGGNTVATSATISTSPPAIAGNLATSTSITFTVDPTSGPPNDNA